MLKAGDVIVLEKGHAVYAKVPSKFLYANVGERSKDANKLAEHDIEIGDVLKTSKNKFDTRKFIGEYVVMHTAYGGGGTGMGPNDVYPDGHHVFCRKLTADGKFNVRGLEVNFYQSGCFTAMIEKIKPVRRMRKSMAFK